MFVVLIVKCGGVLNSGVVGLVVIGFSGSLNVISGISVLVI